MEQSPVAGNLIQIELWFGVTLREAVEIFFLPGSFIIIPRYIPGIPMSPQLGLVFGFVGMIFGVLVLYFKNGSQRPLQYLRALLRYHLTTNTYYKRRRRETELGDIQDIPISQMDESFDTTNYGDEALSPADEPFNTENWEDGN
jgi:hypothetical protein